MSAAASPPVTTPAEPNSGRFPRALAVIEVADIAARLRIGASAVDALIASDYEVGTMRRRAHGVVRALFAELEGQVML